MRAGAGETLLLDTHIVIWLTEGLEAEMSRSCVQALATAGRERRLAASAVSARELALLVARQRIRMSRDVDSWLALARDDYGIRFVPLDAQVAAASVSLPGLSHRDPFDQILIATARHYGWRLVTRDRAMLDYAALGHVKVLDAGSGRAVGEPRRRPVAGIARRAAAP